MNFNFYFELYIFKYKNIYVKKMFAHISKLKLKLYTRRRDLPKTPMHQQLPPGTTAEYTTTPTNVNA